MTSHPRICAPLLRALAVLLAAAGAGLAEVPSQPIRLEDYLLAPLRVHLLVARDQPALCTTLSEADITRIVAKVNRVWLQAGIGFYVESIVREEPAQAEGTEAGADDRFLWLLSRIPRESFRPDVFNIYYIKEFAVNGVYLTKAIFVKDTASLRKVEGGIDEPLPRVTSHELGHALSLPHRQDTFNLMASGTTGTLLNVAEIERARVAAAAMSRFTPASQVLEKADALRAEGKAAEAHELYARLAALPLSEEALARIPKPPEESPAATQ